MRTFLRDCRMCPNHAVLAIGRQACRRAPAVRQCIEIRQEVLLGELAGCNRNRKCANCINVTGTRRPIPLYCVCIMLENKIIRHEILVELDGQYA